jgi:hypothetical protein
MWIIQEPKKGRIMKWTAFWREKRRVCSMFKILSTYICWKNIYKMQYLEGSGKPVLYIGRTDARRGRPISAEVFPSKKSPVYACKVTADVHKVSKSYYSTFSRLTFVHIFFLLPAENNSVLTGQILVKFYNSGFSKICQSNSALFKLW